MFIGFLTTFLASQFPPRFLFSVSVFSHFVFVCVTLFLSLSFGLFRSVFPFSSLILLLLACFFPFLFLSFSLLRPSLSFVYVFYIPTLFHFPRLFLHIYFPHSTIIFNIAYLFSLSSFIFSPVICFQFDILSFISLYFVIFFTSGFLFLSFSLCFSWFHFLISVYFTCPSHFLLSHFSSLFLPYFSSSIPYSCISWHAKFCISYSFLNRIRHSVVGIAAGYGLYDR
jgi:hypothetical protein